MATPCPYTYGISRESWQRGYDGRKPMAYPGSAYMKLYKAGKAARRADDRKSKPKKEKEE